MAAGSTKRLILTTLAILAFLLVVQVGYSKALTGWIEWDSGQSDTGVVGTRQGFWICRWWATPSLAMFPLLLLTISEHTSAREAHRDPWLLVSLAMILGSIAAAILLGDHNGMPADSDGEWVALLRQHGTWDAARNAQRVSALWLLLPTTLTIAFIVVGARRRASQGALQLVADEDE